MLNLVMSLPGGQCLPSFAFSSPNDVDVEPTEDQFTHVVIYGNVLGVDPAFGMRANYAKYLFDVGRNVQMRSSRIPLWGGTTVEITWH